MESLQSHSEHEEEMSFEQKISKRFSTDGQLNYQHQAFGQGLFTKGCGCAFPNHRLVLLSLGLLNVILLIAAAVTGIYCATAKDLQVPYSAAAPLITELNYLRNHSEIIRTKVEVQAALLRERGSHMKLKLQVKQKKMVSDGLQEQFEILVTERTALKHNKTDIEESCGRCPSGWIFLNSTCYYYSHRSFQPKKNWFDSRADCISRGGNLLVITDLKEQQMMSDNFPKLSTVTSWGNNGFWIGLSRDVEQGKWIWVNGNGAETMYWRAGQPNTNGLQSGNCVAFIYHSDNRKTWYNTNCSDQELNWICEKEQN